MYHQYTPSRRLACGFAPHPKSGQKGVGCSRALPRSDLSDKSDKEGRGTWELDIGGIMVYCISTTPNTGWVMSAERVMYALEFNAPLLAAFVDYGILLAVACFAPREHKRFLLFIAFVPMIFFVMSVFSGECQFLAVTWIPFGFFLASFWQFFIKGFSPKIAALSILLQILGLAFTMWHLNVLIRYYST